MKKKMKFFYFDLLIVSTVILLIFLLIFYSSNDYTSIENFNISKEISYNQSENNKVKSNEKNSIHKYTIIKKQAKQYNIYDNDGTLLYNIIGSFPNLIIHDNTTNKNLNFSRNIDTQNYQIIYSIDLGNKKSLTLYYNGANSVIANLNNYQELIILTGKEFTYQNEILGLVSTSLLTPTQINNLETLYNEKRNNSNEKDDKNENTVINMKDGSEAYIYLLASKQVNGSTIIFPFIFQQIYLDIRKIN